MSNTPYTMRKAATLMLLRDNQGQCETLMLQRSDKLEFGPNAWVFPGGVMDEIDHAGARDELMALRHTAVRETAEEASLSIAQDALTFFLRITTPSGAKRYETHMFASLYEGDEKVFVDGSEIVAHRWMTPQKAIVAFKAGEMPMMPPTVMVLMRASLKRDAKSVFKDFENMSPILLDQTIARQDGKMIVMYQGDSGYETGNPALGEPYHRNVFNGGRDTNWTYQHTVDETKYPMLDGGYFKIKA